jgi:fumarate hydratase subunit beta
MIKITLPLDNRTISSLRAGDKVYISGEVYTARDAAHKRFYEAAKSGRPLPINIKGATIYYTGPTPAKPGFVSGVSGPTTSYRMDKYTPMLLDMGLKGIIGKGRRNEEVINSIVKNKAVYFAAVGGAAALTLKCITKSEVIAYDDLGTEAVRKMTFKDFPVFVAVDSYGNSVYPIK